MDDFDLAKRAVACRHWRWMPGMLPLVVDEDAECVACDRVWRTQGGHTVVPAEAFPDLTDPATLGALLALVREVAQEPGLHVRCMLPYAPDMSGKTPPPWVLYSGRGARWGDRYETEAAALVAALEAAP